MKLEICVHCWHYSRLLCYQLSSLCLYPPARVEVTATVFHADEDRETTRVLEWFAVPLREVGVKLKPWLLPRSYLLRRAIGRHEAAKATGADWIWMTDADYLFGERCLDSLPETLAAVEGPLAFPRRVAVSRSHQIGDDAIHRINEPGIYQFNASEFRQRRVPRAIGGVQIYRGDTARAVGYLPPGPRGHQPVDGNTFRKCRCDALFRRRQLRTPGTAINIPSVYRIRHTQCGRRVPGLRL